MQYSDINALAEKQRHNWGIDNYSPINMVPLILEKQENLTILFSEMPENIYGACSKSEDDLLMIINSIKSHGRQNFTIAHELYHLLFENNYELIVCGDGDDENEIKANKFASSFLMPTPALYEFIEKHDIENWSIENIVRCEQFFQISHRSLLHRLKNEKLISDDEFDDFSIDVSTIARRLGFDTNLYEPSPDNKKFYPLGRIIPLTLNNKGVGETYKNEVMKWCYRSVIVNDL